MQTKVLKAFVDKDTKASYNAGNVFTGSADRIAELAAGGFVEEQKAASQKTKTAPAKANK